MPHSINIMPNYFNIMPHSINIMPHSLKTRICVEVADSADKEIIIATEIQKTNCV